MVAKSATAKPKAAKAPAAKSAAPKRPAAKAAPKAAAAKKAPSLLRKINARNRENVAAAMSATRDISYRVIDSQRAIWLAGLGALAKASTAAGAKGGKAFEALVKAGETLESQARVTIDGNADRLKGGIDAATTYLDKNLAKFEDAFDTRVEQAMDRMGFPKSEAFKQLFDRLTELAKKLEEKVRK